TGRRTFRSAGTCRVDAVIATALHGLAADSLGHWTAANMVGADKKDGLHFGRQPIELWLQMPNRQRGNRAAESVCSTAGCVYHGGGAPGSNGENLSVSRRVYCSKIGRVCPQRDANALEPACG